ncbi:hypothetical protein TW95_gp1480 [Pandoravirus inopinatum]|uniref:Transmembrane protein n=1 Tax=Pandoravirus inopinatum TaxID=1605721 RepID=A0A0B5J3Q8_9VIRU|nr:hypothetical protein TW95_gp1480 [Pandoravirus inopinatum]AJF98214.1 hypothetical protein [Pandoravirus inopinatum]
MVAACPHGQPSPKERRAKVESTHIAQTRVRPPSHTRTARHRRKRLSFFLATVSGLPLERHDSDSDRSSATTTLAAAPTQKKHTHTGKSSRCVHPSSSAAVGLSLSFWFFFALFFLASRCAVAHAQTVLCRRRPHAPTRPLWGDLFAPVAVVDRRLRLETRARDR